MSNNKPLENKNTLRHRINTDQVKAIVLFTSSGDDALSVLRVHGPAYHSGIKVIRGVKNGIIQFERIQDADVVLLQRDFSRDLDSYEKIIKLAHEQAKPVVMDLDDLLLDLPENHPDRISNYFTESLLPMLESIIEADAVTVATDALRDFILEYNRNVIVFRNYLNDQLWTIIEPSINRFSNDQISIGYMGGHSHKPDLQMVTEVLLKILNKYNHNIKYKFWGIEPPEELAPFSQVEWCPPKSFEYHEFAAYFQTQTADIMIAPLLDTEFNRCKSPIKYLEYSAIGVPGVFSRITPYESIIVDGVDGLLASSLNEWEKSLSKLIEDKKFRSNIAFNAQKKIRKDWLLSKNAFKFKQLYENIARNYSKHDRDSSPFQIIVKSITRQIFDENKYKKQQMIVINDRFNTLQNELTQISDLDIQKKGQIEQLDGQIIQLNSQIIQLNRILDQSKKVNVQKDVQTEQLYEHIHQLDKIVDQFKEQNIQLNLQIEQLEKQLDQITEQNDRLNEQIGQVEKLNEQIDKLNKLIIQLNDQKANLEYLLNEREEEILSYALSKSWQITRPLRRVSRKLSKVTR